MTVTEESSDGREIFFTYSSGETLVPVNLPWYQENRYVEKPHNKRRHFSIVFFNSH
jgi:hypothetical protein